jgi:hypothetical protein
MEVARLRGHRNFFLANIRKLQYHDEVAVGTSFSDEGGDRSFELSRTKGPQDYDKSN